MSNEHLDPFSSSPGTGPALDRLSALLSAPATERELRGLDAAVAELRAAQVTSVSPTPRRPSMLSSLSRAKIAATVAAAAVGVGGVAAVAVGARDVPAATPSSHAAAAATQTHPAAAGAATGTPAPVGPDATGNAAFGLCTAWSAHERGEGKALDSVAFTALAKAAGGADGVAAYCADVTAPGRSGERATGKPSDVPTGKPSGAGRPAEATRPADVPTGKPAEPGRPDTLPTAPTTHPTGRP